MAVPLPAFFGKYQLLTHLAEGGMADVYLGRLSGPGGFEKRLVVKVIRPELAQKREFCEMFVAEAKITVSLSHANIVPVYELGMVEGQYYLAMELVDGPTVHQLVWSERPGRGGPLPPTLAAYITEQVLRGLDYAHRNGVIHRDLSSANVMCSRDGEVKIVDFGIAARYHAQQGSVHQGGSVGYMAPEQQAGGELDARSDLYAAGVLLGEMATGERFAPRLAGADLAAAPFHLPVPLARLIETATRPRPEDRFPDAAEMQKAVSRYLREVDPPTQADLSRLVRRRAPDERRLGKGSMPRIVTILPRREDGPRTRPLARREDHTPTHAKPTTASLSELVAEAPAREPEGLPPPPPPPAPQEGPAPQAELPEPAGLPPPGGTVTFASRPAVVHATWRTYAGAVLLLGVLGFGALGVRALRAPGGTLPLPPAQGGAPPGPAAQVGALHIELPADASLQIDGQAASPGASLPVRAGRHRIEARAPGHRAMVLDVDVHAGETVRERLVLPWSVGHLRLESEPSEAQVLSNGEVMGQTPLDLDVPLDRTATLRLSLKGHATLVREILPSQWVAASPEARLGPEGDSAQGPPPSEAEGRQPEMHLVLALDPLGRGMLTVGATPWAQVFVDGERRGDTPLRRLQLSAGSHALRLYCPPQSCQEAREFRQNITVEPGRELRRIVDFRLHPPDVKD